VFTREREKWAFEEKKGCKGVTGDEMHNKEG
jgi:hypothetical protein